MNFPTVGFSPMVTVAARSTVDCEPFTAENVRSVRPSHGLHTRYQEEVLGRRAARRIEAGTPLAWELIA